MRTNIVVKSIVSTDLFVAYYYFYHDHLNWAILTLSLVLIPGWIVSFFSLYWLVEDNDGKRPSVAVVLLHLLCLAPVWRYFHTIKALINQRPSATGKFKESLSDVSMLRLIEGILESAPQLMLQLYIIMTGTVQTDFVAALCAAFSMVSISWGLVSYVRALRRAYGTKQMSRTAVFIYFLWVCICHLEKQSIQKIWCEKM